MLDILQTYLNGASSPEFVQMIREAHESLDLFGVPDYQDAFVQLLMLDDAVDQGETVQNIYDTTFNYQVKVLTLLGVTVSDEVRVDHLTRILRAIHSLEEFEDPEKVLERAKLEYKPEELFAEILASVSATPPEEWLVDIHAVSQRTIEKIIEEASRAVSLQLTDETGGVDPRQHYIVEYKSFKTLVEKLNLKAMFLMDTFFAAGMDVGFPLVIYLNLVGDTFGSLTPTDAAVNLVSMALISTDGCDRPREAIKAHLDHYIHDLDLLTKVDMNVNQILLQYEIAKTSGVRTTP
jgi:hypothetical protein